VQFSDAEFERDVTKSYGVLAKIDVITFVNTLQYVLIWPDIPVPRNILVQMSHRNLTKSVKKYYFFKQFTRSENAPPPPPPSENKSIPIRFRRGL
jgi:hypothetical protein